MRSMFSQISKASLAMMILIATCLCVSEAWAKRDYRAHNGYISETEFERDQDDKDLVLLSPLPDDGPSLKDRIFNEKLSKEFREKYEDKFGRTDAERIYNSPNRTTYYNDVWYRGSPEEMSGERRKFADFMMKRLVEYHADNYMKTTERGKQIYAIKERVSNVGVQVQKFKFDFRYELAGNTLDLIVKNPYLDNAKIRFAVSSGGESIVTLGKVITPTITAETYYVSPVSRMSFVLRKMLSPVLSTTASATSGRQNKGPTDGLAETWVRESVYLLGANYAF